MKTQQEKEQTEKERYKRRFLSGEFKKRYQDNKERLRKESREHFKKHRDKILEKNKVYLKAYNKLPETKEKRKEYYDKKKQDPEWNRRQYTRRLTRYKLGSVKGNFCKLCEEKTPAIEWHHYTEPYQIECAIPLCDKHHKMIHSNGGIK
mgnify:FL=1